MVNQVPNRKRPNPKRLQQAMAAQHNAQQLAINATLWRIIQENAESQEDYDPEQDAILTVPREDFDGVPATFGLKVAMNENSITITATNQEPKSNLILPDKKIVL